MRRKIFDVHAATGSTLAAEALARIGALYGIERELQEIARDPPRRLLMQLDEGELGRAIDGDEQVEPALRRVDLGQIDVEVAERVGFEA